MNVLRSRRGAGLVDVIATLFLLAIVGLVFSATFPPAYSCLGNSRGQKVAAAIAQQKIEQLRAMNYESLTQPLLYAAGVIDSSPASSPYSFTDVDDLAGQLADGRGTLEITDYAGDVKRVRVTVSWRAPEGLLNRRTVQITTLFADKRTRRAT